MGEAIDKNVSISIYFRKINIYMVIFFVKSRDSRYLYLTN